MISRIANQWWTRRSYVAVASSRNENGTRQLLFVDAKEVSSANAWIFRGKYKSRKPKTQIAALSAVGLFIEFYLSENSPNLQSFEHLCAFSARFYSARLNGTYSSSQLSPDKTGLYWSAITTLEADREISYIESFVHFCATKLQMLSFVDIDAAFISQITKSYQNVSSKQSSVRLKNYSMLSHLTRDKEKLSRKRREGYYDNYLPLLSLVERDTSTKRSIANTNPVAFPSNRVLDMIIEGCRISKNINLPYHKQFNVRDQLLFSLYLFGALRGGEPLHIWTRDVSIGAKGLDVLLWHPEDSGIKDKNEVITRKEFLMRHYGILPRTLRPVKADATYVGWKSILMTGNESDKLFAPVVWILTPDEIQQFIVKLTRLYLNIVRPESMSRARHDHPFLFVSEGGEVLTDRAARKQWDAAARRIGLTGRRSLGENRHAARHYCAMQLMEAKLDTTVIQAALHHTSPLSQRIYTRAEYSNASKKIQEAYQRISTGDLRSEYISPAYVKSKIDPFRQFSAAIEGLL